MDAIRERFLRDRVMTATPAQRVVLLYDRLALDLARARTDAAGPAEHLDHAAQIVAELLGSLDRAAGGPAENLASLYGYMLREFMTAQLSGSTASLTSIEANVWTLREAWAAVADGVAGGSAGGVVGGAADGVVGGAAGAQQAAPVLAGASWTA